MKWQPRLGSLCVIAALMVGTTAFGQSPPADQVYIQNLSYAGTGCPAGTASSYISPDAQAFTIAFDQFVAVTGPSVSFVESRKNCRLLVDLRFPQGWTYAIFRADYRGFAALDRYVYGLQRSYYYFQGTLNQVPLRTTLRGPYNNDYLISDTLGLETVVWHPCGARRALNIDSSVQVRSYSYGSQGLMTVDSIDGEVEHTYHVRWRRC